MWRPRRTSRSRSPPPDDEAPTGLSAALAEGGGVALSWTAPAEDAGSVTGYEVLRSVGEGDMATLAADTASTATTYTDATATVAGETYAYQVKAIRGEDRSQASGQAEVQVPHAPVDLAPTGLTACSPDRVSGGGGGGLHRYLSLRFSELDCSRGGRRYHHRLRGPARRGRGGACYPGGRYRKHDNHLHGRHDDGGWGDLRLPGEGRPGRRP